MVTRSIAMLLLSLAATPLLSQVEWTPINGELVGAGVGDLVVTPAGTPILSETHGLYRYERLFDPEIELYAWKQTDDRIGTGPLDVSPGGRILTRITSYGMHTSLDDGRSWKPLAIPYLHRYKYLDDTTVVGISGSGFYHIRFHTTGVVRVVEGRLTSASGSNILVGPERRLFVYPSTTFGDQLQISESLDTGRTWKNRLLTHAFRRLEIIDGEEWIGLTNDGIYHSDDEGRSWSKSSGLLLDYLIRGNGRGEWFATMSSAPLDGYPVRSLLRSTDNGREWIIVADSVPAYIVVAPDGTMWGDGWRTLYRSVDGGMTWIESADGLTSLSFAHVLIDTAHGAYYATRRRVLTPAQRDYVHEPNQLLYTIVRSTSHGEEWTTIADSVADIAAIDEMGGIYVIKDSLYRGTSVNFDSTTTDFRAATDRLYRSADGGATWRQLPQQGHSILPSESNPNDWRRIASSSNGRIVLNYASLVTTGRILLRESFAYYSEDSARTWIALTIDEGIPDSSVFCVRHIFNDGEMLVTTWKGNNLNSTISLWLRDRSGNVSALASSLTGLRFLQIVNDSLIFAYGSGLYKSTDRGATWSTVKDGAYPIVGLAYISADTMYIGSPAMRTFDGGATWDSVYIWDSLNVTIDSTAWGWPSVIGAGKCVAMTYHIDRPHPRMNNEINHQYALKYSCDNAVSWTDAAEPIKYLYVEDVAFDETNAMVVATAWNGLYRSTRLVSEVPDRDDAADMPEIWISYDPDTRSARLIIDDLAAEEIDVMLFDLLGRLYRSGIVSGHRDGGGEIRLDLGDVDSGLYFCHIRIGRKSIVIPLSIR